MSKERCKGSSLDKLKEYCDTNDLDLHVANDHTLQIDLDDLVINPIPHQELCDAVLNLLEAETATTTSRSGKLHHYFYINRDLPAHVRIGLQLILGSDPTRELLSLEGLINKVEAPLVLFEKKGTDVETRVARF